MTLLAVLIGSALGIPIGLNLVEGNGGAALLWAGVLLAALCLLAV